MKIELKRITHNERLSEETNCFAADLWIDDVKVGTISNHGHGGCDEFSGDRAAYDRADAWCKANLPRWSFGGELGEQLAAAGNPADHETDLEIHVSNLLNAYLNDKSDKALLARNILWNTPDKPHDIYQIGFSKPKGRTLDTLRAHVMGKHPTAKILNDLTFAEAQAILRHSL